MCHNSFTGMDVLFLLAFVASLMVISIPLLMYLDGYWLPERCHERWKRNSFLGLDERSSRVKEIHYNTPRR